jgi:HSP20 family protein
MEKWDRPKDIFSLRERVNKLFEDIYAGDAKSTVWIPTVDIYETHEEFVVKAELPEVREQDIGVTVEGNTLKISGERRSFAARQGAVVKWHQAERTYGTFSRSFILPADVEQEKIKAALDNGILKIVLPKKRRDLTKHIEIQ